MAGRRATGSVVERRRRTGVVFGLRFTLPDGTRRYVTLGQAEEGWTRQRAAAELRHTMSDVERGIWTPPKPAPVPEVDPDPGFHAFASEWFDAGKAEWREKTRLDYEWQLTHHLLPFFRNHRLSHITIAEVDRYRTTKAKQGTISATSINKTIARLAQILEVAVEYDLLKRNPARGKRRRLKASKPAPVWLDSAEQIEALLSAAHDLDMHAELHGGHDQKGGLVYRRALLATLTFAGLRIGELLELRWKDVDLAAGRITVRMGKTSAATRRIDLLPALRDELTAHKMIAPSIDPDRFVFVTAAGTQLKQGNVRRRVLDKAIERANEKLTAAGDVPLPEGLTPHKLRHTFASILVALGVDAGAVMDQLGHADPGFTLRVYRHAMRRDDEAKQGLRALVSVEDHDVKRHQKGTSEKIEHRMDAITTNGHPAGMPY